MLIKYYLCGNEQPISQYPLGLGYLLSNARGYEAEIVDKPGDLRGADVIGLSTLTDGVAEAVEVARMYKGYPVIVGGQGTLWPGIGKLYRDPNVDVDILDRVQGFDTSPRAAFDRIVWGEGEAIINKLMQGFVDDVIPNVIGPSYRLPLAFNPKPCGPFMKKWNIKYGLRAILPIDTIKPPERGHCGDEVPILTSRGCPHNCKFCSSSTYWGTPRYHSAEYVIDEVKMLSMRYKHATKLRIFDDSFISNKVRFEKLYKMWMGQDLQYRWELDGFVRADDMTVGVARSLKQMGFRFVRFGAEAASDRLLKSAGKTTTAEDNQRCIDVCNEAGLPVCMSMMSYLPGETPEDRRTMAAFLTKNKGKVTVAGNYRFLPYPGTAYYNGEDVLSGDWRIRG